MDRQTIFVTKSCSALLRLDEFRSSGQYVGTKILFLINLSLSASAFCVLNGDLRQVMVQISFHQ
jgi:hypothetical protein